MLVPHRRKNELSKWLYKTRGLYYLPYFIVRYAIRGLRLGRRHARKDIDHHRRWKELQKAVNIDYITELRRQYELKQSSAEEKSI